MNSNYGFLIDEKDLLLQRKYFEEMAAAIGVKVLHRAPRPGKTYTNYGEIDSCYYEPELVACIFDEHPNPRTMKNLFRATSPFLGVIPLVGSSFNK